jgi:mannonate dehydratase
MKRRDFGKTLAGGVIGAGLAGSAKPWAGSATAAAPVPKKNTLMHVGADYHSVAGTGGLTSKQNLEYNLRFGVKHLSPQVSKIARDGSWDLDELKTMKENCDKFGVEIECIRMEAEYIALPKGPERDRKLDAICENIRRAHQIGVKVISYHWTVIPIRRNGQAPGRGGVTYETFKLEDNWKDLPVGKAGRVTADDYWERITHFLERVIPVAKENDVKMGCHPYDPPGLPFGYQGADNWDAPSVFEGLKRYASVVDSPYNAFQLCLGTTSEGLKNPKTELLPIVQYFGERGKLVSIHMRNIRGGLYNFAEVFPDEGDVDFFQVMRILRDVQYPYMILPDHNPSHPDDPGKLQAYAFGYGYIKALIQAVNSEVQG